MLATLRERITVAVVLLVLFACALVAVLSLDSAEREMRATVGAQQFALLSSAAAYLDADIAQKRTLLRTVADSIAFSQPVDPGRIQGILERYTSLHDEFANVVGFDAAGVVVADLRDRRQIGLQGFDQRAYFKDTMRMHEGVVSEPFLSKLSNRPVVLITEPVYDANGNIVSILGGSIDLAQPTFFGQIATLNPGRRGYLFALTREGLILHHPRRERLLKNVLSEAGTPVPSTVAAMHGWEGWTIGKSKDGTPAVLTYKRMRNPDWILGVVYPSSEAFLAVSTARRSALLYAAIVALLAGLGGWYVMRVLLDPLRKLRATVHAVEAGQLDIGALDLQRQDEVGALGRAFYSLSAQRQAAEARLAELVRTDALTGLGNRRCLEHELAEAIARTRRNGTSLALAFLDIDRFKSINDGYGHETGDMVLKMFAERLRSAVRPTDHVYRFAGDEFVIVFEPLASEQGAARVAQKILDKVRVPFALAERSLDVSTSIGLALCDGDEADAADLMRRADAALYETKRRGRDGYTIARREPG
jgi:diguanylate cyclase (GGDEF)-like protein